MNTAASSIPDGRLSNDGWTESGGHRLYRRHLRPTTGAIARLLILHGYGDHSGRYLHVMHWLANHGVACDAFDFQGHGRSEGKRGFVRRWDAYLEDLRAVLTDAKSHASQAGNESLPLFVLGHSHGGLIAAAAGIEDVLSAAGVRGVVLSAPYLQPFARLSPIWQGIAAVTNIIAPSLQVANGLSADTMSSDPAMIEDSRNDPLLLRAATPRWYASTLDRQNEVMAAADRFQLPLLTLAGTEDRIADAAAAQRFVDGAGSTDKAFLLLPGQKHEILRETERVKTFGVILEWVHQRISL